MIVWNIPPVQLIENGIITVYGFYSQEEEFMTNVLVLSSSPRKGGNTDMLCDALAKGTKEAGNKVM